MPRTTDEHYNQLEVEDKQTLAETETLDDDNYDEELAETEPIKKSVLPIKTIATVGVLAALIGGISIAIRQFKPASSMEGMDGMKNGLNYPCRD